MEEKGPWCKGIEGLDGGTAKKRGRDSREIAKESCIELGRIVENKDANGSCSLSVEDLRGEGTAAPLGDKQGALNSRRETRQASAITAEVDTDGYPRNETGVTQRGVAVVFKGLKVDQFGINNPGCC